MYDDAPYSYCCTVECENMFCEECQAESKRVTNMCPYEEQEDKINGERRSS